MDRTLLTLTAHLAPWNRHGRDAAGVLQTVTDRLDPAATEVVPLYRQRWQIERFFRWLEHRPGVLHPLGHSSRGVLLTLYRAAIIAVPTISPTSRGCGCLARRSSFA